MVLLWGRVERKDKSAGLRARSNMVVLSRANGRSRLQWIALDEKSTSVLQNHPPVGSCQVFNEREVDKRMEGDLSEILEIVEQSA